MLFLEDEFKWTDEVKDSEIINWYYNLYNLGRYINVHKDEYIKKETEIWNSSIFNKKKPLPSFDIGKYIDLEIVSSYHRKILSMFDPNTVTSLSNLLKSADEFTDLMLFIQRTRNDDEKSIISVEEEKNKKSLIINTRLELSLDIKLTAINKSSSGNVILDMLESNKDKYVTMFTLTIDCKDYSFISDEDPKLTTEEKMILTKAGDRLLTIMHNTICEKTSKLINVRNYEPTDSELISTNLARGKIYV